MRRADYHQPLLPDNTYHLFSRAVGGERLFIQDQNYHFFLLKFLEHTHCVCEPYTYSLLPNHFHLLVRIRPFEQIVESFNALKNRPYDKLQDSLPDFIMERFSNFLNSYAKGFNKVYRRKGALFIDYLKRSVAGNDADFAAFIWYIHKNAVHHGLVAAVGEWEYDGFNLLLSDAPTSLLRNEVIDFFGDVQQFLAFHQQPVLLKNEVLDV